MRFIKYTYKTLFILILFSVGVNNKIHAQTSFSISDSLKTITFPSNEFVFYTWAVLTNNTNTDLNLRWVRSYVTPLPATWSNQVQLLDSIYTSNVDSADFVLPAIAGFADYALIFFYPNNTVASCRARLDIFDPLNPSDGGHVTFWATTTSPTDISTVQSNSVINLYPNPTKNNIHFENAFSETVHWKLYDLKGQIVDSGILIAGVSNINFNNAPHDGMYILKLQNSLDELIYNRKLQFKN
ncbi:MAG: T9SS type A sorting domain-containing protein [Bacteroidia bacterium]|nr:T9SS type A sorting domain-containing protein [Bacteroidia bacterium]NNC86420.1 T9SS type A sorting domain-containing protein [Bacteroidia bacterium]NNM16594.1 T9SS type A sorting domain-containing protein [Bacteroidia bacterium]